MLDSVLGELDIQVLECNQRVFDEIKQIIAEKKPLFFHVAKCR